MNVVNLHAFKASCDLPLLLLCDLQREYLHAERPLGLQDPIKAIAHCGRLLEHARRMQFPVAFVRWVQPAKLFNPKGVFTDWIEGFAPRGSELVFEHAWPSAYSSPEFASLMAEGWGCNVAIAGLTGTMTCLSTIIDGAQRQHHYAFIADASQSHAYGPHPEATMHTMTTNVIGHYARIESTDAWIERTARRSHSGQAREYNARN